MVLSVNSPVYGMVLGGNSSSAALGPTSVIPVQVGISLNAPTPTFTAIVRDSERSFITTLPSAAVCRLPDTSTMWSRTPRA